MAPHPSKKIIITGGSGFIGTKLTEYLLSKGYSVLVIDIIKPKIEHQELTFLQLDISSSFIPKEYDGAVYAVIHLAGKNIFGRWTKEFKQGLFDSRIKSTQNIIHSFSSWQNKPEVFISASAFGFYGDKKEIEVSESESKGSDFLSDLCFDWETEAAQAQTFGLRVVHIRTAHVLGMGGLLAPLFVPFRFGLGAWIGKGYGWLPWIHINDLVRAYTHALETNTLSGPLNVCSPQQVRQKEFMQHFGKVFNKKVFFSIPIFILRLRYLDLALTFNNSVKMSPKKLIESGYTHQYPDLFGALKDVIKK